jgi:hypothetical protein
MELSNHRDKPSDGPATGPKVAPHLLIRTGTLLIRHRQLHILQHHRKWLDSLSTRPLESQPNSTVQHGRHTMPNRQPQRRQPEGRRHNHQWIQRTKLKRSATTSLLGRPTTLHKLRKRRLWLLISRPTVRMPRSMVRTTQLVSLKGIQHSNRAKCLQLSTRINTVEPERQVSDPYTASKGLTIASRRRILTSLSSAAPTQRTSSMGWAR